jgi:hypothetical protein
MRYRRLVIAAVVALSLSLGSAWAQFAVTDPATTARNAVVAGLKNRIVDTARVQHDRLLNMARRLSALTNLEKYRPGERPEATAYDEREPIEYGESYRSALREGDISGSAFLYVARTRQAPGDAVAALTPTAREVVAGALATLDVADSTIIAGTHQVGALRSNARRELTAIDALESDVIDPSDLQSATAVLDKISGATLLETRQKQARLQYLSAIVEQLVVDNKRARDTETAVLNMQLHRLLSGTGGEEGGGLLTGAADDLRMWRQP